MLLCVTTFSANAQWSLTGNTGTNSSTNFIGTKDLSQLTFRTNNVPRMYINSYGGVGIIDPGSNPYSASHPILLYLQKTSPGAALSINMASTTNGSAAIYAASSGPGNSIHGNASQAGSSGVYGENSNGYGLRGNSYNSYGLVTRSTNYYGMVAIGKSYAAYFVGSVFASNGYHAPSDQKLKQNIEDVTSARDIISQLHPKKYYYRQDGHHKLMKLPQDQQYGLLAQEVEKVLPGLVKNTKFEPPLETAPVKMDADGKFDLQPQAKPETIEFKAVNYVGMVPILIKGMQEQQEQLQAQQEKILSQDRKIENLTALVNQLLSTRLLPENNGSSKIDDVLATGFVSQNAPNPFNQTTTIRYFVPLHARHAAITIASIQGDVVKTYTISERGNGQLEIESGKLVPGIYQYSLNIDDKLIDTKKMVVLN